MNNMNFRSKGLTCILLCYHFDSEILLNYNTNRLKTKMQITVLLIDEINFLKEEKETL